METAIRACPQIGLFRGSHARADGSVRRRHLFSNAFRRVLRDVYVPSGSPVDYLARCYGAALLVPKGAVLTGRSAAAVYGVPLSQPGDPVEFVASERNRFGPIRNIQLRRSPVRPQEQVPWEGIGLATPMRMAIDLLLRQAPREKSWRRRLQIAVSDLDRIARAGLVDLDELAEQLSRRRDSGIVLARQAVALADPRAESPPESELRVLLMVNGLMPVPQFVVRGRRRFAGRADLAFPEAKLAIEYDGRWHFDPAQRKRDLARLARLRSAGWRVISITAERLRDDPDGIVEEVQRALRANRATRRVAAESSGLRRAGAVHSTLAPRSGNVKCHSRPAGSRRTAATGPGVMARTNAMTRSPPAVAVTYASATRPTVLKGTTGTARASPVLRQHRLDHQPGRAASGPRTDSQGRHVRIVVPAG